MNRVFGESYVFSDHARRNSQWSFPSRIFVSGAVLVVVAATVAGCSQRLEVAETEVRTTESNAEKSMHEDHNHHHAFASPAELAKKWNDPERDKSQHPEEIVAAMALKPGATVADIGAGTGYMVAHLSKAVGDNGTVIAIDASAEMVDYLKKHRVEFAPARIVPQKVGYHDPELPDEGVDGVLTLDTWHHIERRDEYAKKVYDGLKPGGRFVVVDYDVNAKTGPPKEMRLDPVIVTQQLTAAGFRVEVLQESMPQQYLVVGHKD